MSQANNLMQNTAYSQYKELHPEISEDLGIQLDIRRQITEFFVYQKQPKNAELKTIVNNILDDYNQDVADSAADFIEEAQEKIIETSGKIADIIPNFGENIFKKFGEIKGDLSDKMYSWFKDIGMLDDETIVNLKSLAGGEDYQNPFLAFTILFSLLQSYVQATGNIIGGDFAKRMNSIYTPAVPDNSTAVRGMFIAPEKYDDYIKMMKQNGLSDSDIDNYIISNYALQDMTTIQTMFWRKHITPEQTLEKIQEYGFTPQRAKETLNTWSVIPGISDILYMLAKEAFEPDQIRELGLNAEFPDEAVQYAESQGLSRDWLEKYWYAHWEIPPVQQGYEMLHRRVINEKQLDSLFRAQEIPPFWRDKLKAISYNPYTRVDIRRMYDEGVVDETEVYETYLDLGYDAEHAKKMTDWTIKYVEPNERDLTMSQVKKGYRDDLINRNDAEEYLSNIGYTKDSSSFILNYIDFEEAQAITDSIVKNAKKGFVSGKFSEEKTKELLNNGGLTFDKIAYLIELWTIELEASEKLLTKEDLFKALAADVVGQTEVEIYLKKLNYSDESIRILIETFGAATDE